jgi:hypothetical protein
MSPKPIRSSLSVLAQLCKLIPAHLVSKVAKESGVEKKARTFSPWSHVLALLFAQFTHALSLNDVCDALKSHAAKLLRIRSATVPSKNAFSHGNRERDGAMAETLFWKILNHFIGMCPKFGGQHFHGMPRRFKRAVHAVDSSTIRLVVNCIDWARHRRRKAAAKLHLRLNLQCFLPAFALVDTAAHNDNKRAREVCAGLEAGEIAVFDKAYVDFAHLFDLAERGVFWVTRAKDNLQYRVKKRLEKKPEGKILRDDLVVLTSATTAGTRRPCVGCGRWWRWAGRNARWISSPTTSSGRRRVSRTSTRAGGRSRCSSRRSSRRCSCATFWATTRTRSCGRSGRL